jgi:hypothetical protein
MSSNICNICEIKLSHSKNINQHQKTEKCQNIKRLIENKEKNNLLKIINIEKEIQELKEKNKLLEKQNEDKDNQIMILKEKSEEYRKIVEKVALKTTTKTINKYTQNNYMNYLSIEPLKISEIPKQIKQLINCDNVMWNNNDFHDHIVDNILKDKNGKDKILCTDINRKNFSYKDEKSGELISDPELENLREKLTNGTDLRKLRSDLLKKLIKEYEDNGYTGIDPYEKFYEILQKLNFGNPFVDHVAKKTYIKTKTNETNEINENNENNELYTINEIDFSN